MGLIIGLIVLLLILGGAAYGYFMYYLPMTTSSQNTLTTTQPSNQDELSSIEAGLGAESDATFDTEMESLENSF